MVDIMTAALSLSARRALRQLGSDISLARRRRRISTTSMAERADISRATLSKIEKGDQSVSIGAYVSVLMILGFEGRLGGLASAEEDEIGLVLEADRIPKRIRD